MSEIECRGVDLIPLSAEVLGQGCALRFRAHGQSMSPFIRDGQAVEIAPLPGRGLRAGDIAFYRSSSGLSCAGQAQGCLRAHRVVKRWSQGGATLLQTRGDGCYRPDAPIDSAQVLGVVVSVQRGERWRRLDRGLARIAGLVWSGALPARAVIWPWLARLKRLMSPAGGRPAKASG